MGASLSIRGVRSCSAIRLRKFALAFALRMARCLLHGCSSQRTLVTGRDGPWISSARRRAVARFPRGQWQPWSRTWGVLRLAASTVTDHKDLALFSSCFPCLDRIDFAAEPSRECDSLAFLFSFHLVMRRRVEIAPWKNVVTRPRDVRFVALSPEALGKHPWALGASLSEAYRDKACSLAKLSP
jgi:hypothetical protein